MTELCVSSVGKTLRHELLHLIAAGLLGVVVWSISKNTAVILITFAVCFFLDLDHLVDYLSYLIKFRRQVVIAEFFSGSYFEQWRKFITPLHSWELVIAAIVAGAVTQSTWPLCVALALAVHYLMDYITNPVNVWAYWFIYRARHRWHKPAIARGFIG